MSVRASRRVSILAAICAIACPAAAQAQADITAGEFGTAWGKMVLRNGNGTYEWSNGRINGQLAGNTLTGHWVQSTSARKCGSSQFGSEYWGRINFKFDASGNFTGDWSYCDEAMQSGWNGARQGSGPAYATGEFGTGWGKMVLANGNGTYEWSNGRINGQLSGTTMTGYWMQSTSARRCPNAQFDTDYWGKISFKFDPSTGNFTGDWSYCNEPMQTGWNGARQTPLR